MSFEVASRIVVTALLVGVLVGIAALLTHSEVLGLVFAGAIAVVFLTMILDMFFEVWRS